ncbi:MAG TPA: hypothetical protein VMY37_02040 [Thermoguttaceae bacterium]|nr:hypothetical protein [Thermoguttaceae bacterium]
MASSQAVAEPVSTGLLERSTGYRRAERDASEDLVGRSEREALRRRLFEMILRNEQLRRARPR